MKFLEQIERINEMHRLICTSSTGTPREFAKRLNISRTTLYEYIDELKSRSAPIAYSRQEKTFYYKRPFIMKIDIQFREI